MKEIQLNHGKVAFVDDEDYERLCGYKYSFSNHGYARRYCKERSKNVRTSTCILMHHEIIGIPPVGLMVDHINRDRLDNRKSNLRFVTRKQNNANRKKIMKSSKPLFI